MPFNPINFANIKPQGNPFFRDFVDNLASGYKAGQLPGQLARQKKQEEIANAMQQLLLDEQPQKFGEESQGRQLTNALSKFKVQEEPQRFGSEMSSAAMERAFHQAQANKLNTMTPLEAAKMSLENEWYPKAEQAKINEQNSLADYHKTGGGTGSIAEAKAERNFQNLVLKDNPHLSAEQAREASNVLREGGDSLEDGTKLNPLSADTQAALDAVIKSTTTASTTANRQVVNAIKNVLPGIKRLMAIDEPNQITGALFSPSAQADYMSEVISNKDALAIALRFPKTVESMRDVEKILRRQPGESHAAYHDRLSKKYTELEIREKAAESPQRTKSGNKEQTVEEEGTYEGKPVVKVNGKWHYK